MLQLGTSSLGKLLLLALLAGISEAQSSCPADANEPWSYRGNNGPNNWGVNYTQCNGEFQSGINIVTSDVVQDNDLAGLEFQNYDVPVVNATMLNNGHTIEILIQDGVARTITVENEIYSLLQLHFHWGCNWGNGSEHKIDDVSQSMEMHLVHQSEDGRLAVVGVLMEESFSPFQLVFGEMSKIVSQLPQVKYRDQNTVLRRNLNLRSLLPNNVSSFYRYNGSLTTPPCSEGVTWSVMRDPVRVSILQMSAFRRGPMSVTRENDNMDNRECKLCGNFRPVQPIGTRQVTSTGVM